MATALPPAFIVSARRTAIGRIGGLHGRRRLDALCAPVVAAALADAKVAANQVEALILGNASEGGNPARLVGLASGLADTISAFTLDRHCGSGLDAILLALATVARGDASIIVAGGGESLSTAPWRVARPRGPVQAPRFLDGLEGGRHGDGADGPHAHESAETFARTRQISREGQDGYALQNHLAAESARSTRRFVGEIVPLRGNPEETRDESARPPTADDLAELEPYFPPDGTLTPGNTSHMHDGAAFAVIVSEPVWSALGRPPALRLMANAACGVAPHHEAEAPVAAMGALMRRLNGFDRASVGAIETSERSAAQAIAIAGEHGFDQGLVNRDGGAIVRGHPYGASGAVLVTRLFTQMIRSADRPARRGIAVQGAIGGQGLAALFEAAG